MKKERKWYEEYDYELMWLESDRLIGLEPGFTVDKKIEFLQSLIDYELNEKKTGDHNEKELAHFIKSKILWETYNRDHTIREIISYREEPDIFLK